MLWWQMLKVYFMQSYAPNCSSAIAQYFSWNTFKDYSFPVKIRILKIVDECSSMLCLFRPGFLWSCNPSCWNKHKWIFHHLSVIQGMFFSMPTEFRCWNHYLGGGRLIGTFQKVRTQTFQQCQHIKRVDKDVVSWTVLISLPCFITHAVSSNTLRK